MTPKQTYQIVCRWPSEVWEVQAIIDPALRLGKTVYICNGKKWDGYNEAKQWLKENDPCHNANN